MAVSTTHARRSRVLIVAWTRKTAFGASVRAPSLPRQTAVLLRHVGTAEHAQASVASTPAPALRRLHGKDPPFFSTLLSLTLFDYCGSRSPSPSSGKTTAFCSTAMLTFGVDQSYGYIACGPDPKTEHYIISPTFTPPTTATSTTPTKSPSTTTPTSSSSSMSSLTTKTSNSQRLNTSTLFAVSQTPAGVNSSTGQINQQQSGSGTNLGAIIGGVIGGLALLCLSVVTVVFIVKKNWWNKKAHSPPTTSAPFQPAPPYAPHAPHPPYASYEQRQPPQVYPSVFEAASSSNKFKPIKHTGYGGYAAYAVELP